MGKFFSDDVETALQYIYYDNRLRLHRGQEGFNLLLKASEAGDGDADCVLARCLSGYQYVGRGGLLSVHHRKYLFLVGFSFHRGKKPKRFSQPGSLPFLHDRTYYQMRGLVLAGFQRRHILCRK